MYPTDVPNHSERLKVDIYEDSQELSRDANQSILVVGCIFVVIMHKVLLFSSNTDENNRTFWIMTTNMHSTTKIL